MVSCKLCLAAGAALLAALAYFLLPSTPPFDPASIRGQSVVITGASTGIGEQLAYVYSKLGARITITARREAVLREVATRCRELGAEDVRVVTGDMALDADRKKLMADVEQNGGRIDQLLLNHVFIEGKGFWLGTPENLTALRKDWELNFYAYVDLASRGLPLLTKAGGHLGVVSSVAGKIGMPKLASYSSDKFALQGFFSALRHELHHRRAGVSVTLCVLGVIGTDSAISYNENNQKLDMSIAADPADTATAIMQAVTTGVREMRYPFRQTFVLPFLSLFADFIESSVAQMMLAGE